MIKARLYYKGQLFHEFNDYEPLAIRQRFGLNVYQSGFLLLNEYKYIIKESRWFRCDFTPLLINDVPKELQLLELLIS